MSAPNDPSTAKRYHLQKLRLQTLSTALFIVYAICWYRWQPDGLVAWTESRWIGLLAYAGTFWLGFELLTAPLSFHADYRLEHHYGMSNQTIGRYVSQTFKAIGVGALLGGLLICGLFAMLWHTGALWWLWVGLAWIGLTVVLAQLFPVLLLPLFFKSSPLENDELTNRLHQLASSTSLRVEGIFNLDLSTDTKAANAMLTGLGSTRRVYLSDTLLDAFTPEEIEVVFAHELGHHTRHHIWKQLALSAALGGLSIAILAWFLNPVADPTSWREAVVLVPQIALALTLVEWLTKPIQNGISRHFERQCDADALRHTNNPEAYRSAFERLSTMNLADPDPHPAIEWFFHDHPAMSKRIAMAAGSDD